ncbi:MAG: sigma-70 family RNA polymerase sigma factor [Acidobacteriia bacterium]|nr:sigma-70 family RNA polymerase sigma factor [Terriglobia bacterium]
MNHHSGANPNSLTDALNAPATSASSRWRRIGPLIDRELQRIAGRLVRQFPWMGRQTLEPAELVAEFYVRVLQDDSKHWVDRKHFFAYATVCMQSILRDRHRARNAVKRRPSSQDAPENPNLAPDQPFALAVEIQLILDRLGRMSPRQAEVVEMRFFRGLDIGEIAAAIGVSEKTVQRDWLVARAWLHAELSGRPPAP